MQIEMSAALSNETNLDYFTSYKVTVVYNSNGYVKIE